MSPSRTGQYMLYPIIRRKRRPLLVEAEIAQPAAVPALRGPVVTAQVARGAGDVVVAAAVSSVAVESPAVASDGAPSAVSKPKRSHHKKATPQAN